MARTTQQGGSKAAFYATIMLYFNNLLNVLGIIDSPAFCRIYDSASGELLYCFVDEHKDFVVVCDVSPDGA